MLPACYTPAPIRSNLSKVWARPNEQKSWPYSNFPAALTAQLKRQTLFDAPHAVRDYLQLQLGSRPHEIFAVMFLDSQHRLIVLEELFRGTLTQTSVYPREVVVRALALNAASVVLAHNHPSGTAQPSRADEALTQTLKAALGLVDVRVLDHFVVTSTEAVSMAERGLL